MDQESAYNIWLEYSRCDVNINDLYVLINNINNNIPFTYIRISDGEYWTLFNLKGPEDGILTDDIRSEYKRCLENIIDKKINLVEQEKLILGLEKNTPTVEKFQEQIEKYFGGMEKCIASNTLSYASVKHELNSLFIALNKTNRKIILVGPHYLYPIDSYIRIDHHIITAPDKVWLTADAVKKEVEALVASLSEKKEELIILYSASLCTKFISIDLFDTYKNIIQLDMGACLSPYCGINDRPWHDYLIAEIKNIKNVGT